MSDNNIPKQVELRKPWAEVTSPIGKTSTDELTVNIAINAHTTANFSVYTGNEAGTMSSKVLASDAAALMGEAQNIGFSKRDKADTTIRAYDGRTGKDWSLFMTGPTYLMNTTSIKPGMAAVAESALIANLKLDIYTTNTALKEGTNTSLNKVGLGVYYKDSVSPNLASRLKELTERIIECWKNNKGTDTGPSAQLKQQRHEINTSGPLQQWYAMLDNSVESLKPTEDWLSVIKGAANEFFNQYIAGLLRGQSHDFQEIIQLLCSSFQLVVIPSRTGGPGKFVPMDDLVVKEATELKLPANSMLLNGDVSHDLLPVQQVLARADSYTVFLLGGDVNNRDTDTKDFIVGGFPEVAPSASGDVVIVPLPLYISNAVQKAPNPSGKLPPDKDRVEGNYSDVLKLSLQYASDISKKLVNNYCRSVYMDIALGGSSTSIQVPLDYTLHPGNRHKVMIDGREIFTGFLAGVTHSLRKSPGGGSATTTCQFTHIMFPGFKLPEV